MTIPLDSLGLDLSGLLRRMDLRAALVQRAEGEAIAALLPPDADWLAQERERFADGQPLQSLLDARGWSDDDLTLHLWRPEALRRFSAARFGPGLEERFLAEKEGRDQVVYSILRVRDPGLARELWIRIEEGETSFTEAVAQYSEGPEALHKGVIGPVAIGVLQPPVLADWLRRLRPGEIRPPAPIADWHVMLRLEQLSPARFDQAMRDTLLRELLEAWLQTRVQQRLAGVEPEPLRLEAAAA